MKLRVYWIPQVPMKPFHVDIESIEMGVRIMDILADYDCFQYYNNVKGDYCNVGGIEMFEDGEWFSWYDEESGYDEPREYLNEVVFKK